MIFDFDDKIWSLAEQAVGIKPQGHTRWHVVSKELKNHGFDPPRLMEFWLDHLHQESTNAPPQMYMATLHPKMWGAWKDLKKPITNEPWVGVDRQYFHGLLSFICIASIDFSTLNMKREEMVEHKIQVILDLERAGLDINNINNSGKSVFVHLLWSYKHEILIGLMEEFIKNNKEIPEDIFQELDEFDMPSETKCFLSKMNLKKACFHRADAASRKIKM